MRSPISVARSRVLAVLAGLALVATGFVGAQTAAADTAPLDPTLPLTVSSDPLPTAQANGIVWSQAIAGNTVYAGGAFTTAQPPGAAAGVNTVTRNNLLAYDITTGQLTSFAPNVNGQIRAVAVSPDGTRVYIGGDFTTVNGLNRYRLAAFDTATGNLLSWAPGTNARVSALVATNTAVYFGGSFSTVGAASRPGGAGAALASTGEVLPWAPVAAGGRVLALVINPAGDKLVLGGAFTTMNGGNNPGYGLAAVDAVNGTTNLAWNVNNLIRNGGAESAILSLFSDGTYVYGSGYHFGGGGNLEGIFKAEWEDGDMVVMEDCHGDTYSVWASADVVYGAGHPHYCGNVPGGFEQTDPWTFYRGVAFTTTQRGTITPDKWGYFNFAGNPAMELLHWFPTFNVGSVSGATQGPWHVTGNSQYVVFGGEFTTVNAKRQQGLVRFAIPSIAPNDDGPRLSSATWVPNAVSFSAGTVRVAWPANYDRDNGTLSYRVIRDGVLATPIFETTGQSSPFNQPAMGYLDTGLEPGSTHTYRIRAEDPYGNAAFSNTVSVTVAATGSMSNYASQVLNDGAQHYWRLNEASGTTVYDWAAFDDAITRGTVNRGAAGAINGDTDTASSFTGSNSFASTQTLLPASNSFTIEAWFKTSSNQGGKIVGYGNANTGNSSNYDRHIYMDGNGRVFFGVHPGSAQTINSSSGLNNGQWHHVVASLSANGMHLYIDGVKVAQRGDVTSGQDYEGYWRIGGDSTWAGANYLNGTIDDVAIYGAPLTPSQVNNHWVLSGRTSNVQAAPADAYGARVYADEPDLYWRLDDGNTTARDAGIANAPGTYRNNVTRQVTGGLIGTTNRAASFDGNNDLVSSNRTYQGPTVYSVEAWFRTSTTVGGKIIGFGSSQTGLSDNYDRNIYMQNNGQLAFGTWTGFANVVVSPGSYNNNVWHHVVGTQGPEGLRLYVDGQLVGSNANAESQPYTGYWKIGGDRTWNSTSSYFNGRIDEAAVYSRALNLATVAQHYALGSGITPNMPPTASFTSSVDFLAASFDATASTDSDGTITSYAWNFGDSTTGTGATPSHTYATGGTYTVTLTVTDDDGAVATATSSVTVAPVPPNVLPTAAFTSTANFLVVGFDSSGSSDSDGTIASHAWNFGDSTTSTEANPSHAYAAAGTYTVTLVVTDDDGGTGTTSTSITVSAAPPPNVPPTASYTSSSVNLTASFDATASADSDGTIASYSWSFGDGQFGTGISPSHAYAAEGTYTVTLVVTDDDGDTGTTSSTVTVALPPNVLPTAAFTPTTAGLTVNVDATASTDSDGTISSYAWDFGDGQTGTGATTSHVYAVGGTYTVSLTVTDNRGGTATTTSTVTVNAPPVNLIVSDTFGRTVTGGFGSAELGGAWTLVGGNTNFSVTAGLGRINSNPSVTRSAYLASVTSSNVEVQVQAVVQQMPSGGPLFISALARKTATDEYQARVRVNPDGTVQLQLLRGATTLQAVNIAGLTVTAGDALQIRVQATGTSPTTLQAKVWKVGSTEPVAWQTALTDSTAGMQTTGYIGLRTYLSGSAAGAIVVAFDNLKAGTPGSLGGEEPPANVAPTASFSSTVSNLLVSVNGTASVDPDGTIAGYAWNFGDGGTASGATANHAYAAAGTYTVTLVVTDDDGATDSETASVTVTDPPVTPFVGSDDFGRTVANGLGTADVGGAWTLGSSAPNFAVNGGVGRITSAVGATTSAYLPGVSGTALDVTVAVAPQQAITGGGDYISVIARRVGTEEYVARAKVLADGTVQLQLLRGATTLQSVNIAGLSYTIGDTLLIRVRVTGTSPTTLQAKVWEQGTTEPVAWQVSTTDSTAALQTAGYVGLRNYLSGSAAGAVTVAFDSLRVSIP